MEYASIIGTMLALIGVAVSWTLERKTMEARLEEIERQRYREMEKAVKLQQYMQNIKNPPKPMPYATLVNGILTVEGTQPTEQDKWNADYAQALKDLDKK